MEQLKLKGLTQGLDRGGAGCGLAVPKAWPLSHHVSPVPEELAGIGAELCLRWLASDRSKCEKNECNEM